MNTLFASHALLPQGWAKDVCIDIDSTGRIAAVTTDRVDWAADQANAIASYVLPGMPNLHSHAFQWAMAGLTEPTGQQADNFWTWRQVMYRFLDRLTPDHLEIIATCLYIEMLKAGFTAVAEFHYIHHDPQGRPYAYKSELSARIVAAAQTAGIGLTLLPVVYAHSNFGGQPPTAGQQRFVTTAEQFMDIWHELRDLCDRQPASQFHGQSDSPFTGQSDSPSNSPSTGQPHNQSHNPTTLRLGVAPHSLRAVTPALLEEVLTAIDRYDPTAPVHIHLAEQPREVEDCLAWSGQRPVEWAIAHLPLSPRWCLVHATHMTPTECRAVAESGAIAGICPTTEASLGDGFFPMVEYLQHNGQFGIGSDSNISVSPVEELRWLEYGQRLVHQRRGVVSRPEISSIGEFLYRRAIAGGAQALGQPVGQIQVGYRADLVVLDPDLPLAWTATPTNVLDKMVFVGNQNPIRDVMVAGNWVVRDRQHPLETKIYKTCRSLLRQIQD